MSDYLKPIGEYLNTLQKNLDTGKATEPSYYPTLKLLTESLSEGLTVLNNPKWIDCGAPDFLISKGSTTIGYIEAKDIGKSLDEIEKTDQLKRYKDSLTNLILTDYLEFRWYVDGERRLTAHLGTLTKDNKIKRDKDGIQKVAELLESFLSHEAKGVGTPRELAERMARLTHMIRELIINAFEKETESGSLHAQFSAFRENLIPDLSTEQFADMYAQTIAYGLFAARCTVPQNLTFTRFDAALNLPKTNPFLRKLFQHIAGYDLDDRIAWLVDELAQVLRQADMEAVLKDFGKRTAKEDPVVHFYETFLKEYDPKVRKMRGVYYTPEPVVSYIVRSTDYLLKTRFNKPQGLADPSVLILDPAVGTATFLYNVIKQIHEGFIKQGQIGMWNDYVAEKLLTRLFGFELLMAPYTVAHLKLGLLLQETGYQFESDQRLGIYLTNTLEEAIKKSELLFAQYIVEEAEAAAHIKKDEPIMVVLGNPPYSVSSANKGEHITRLMELYKVGVRDEQNIQPLSDDYIKFIRFAQDRIERTGFGVIAIISNNSYLSGLIHRGMREQLLKSFSEVYILDLHGSAVKQEVLPDNGSDENVFDIKQEVAIAIFVRIMPNGGPANLRYASLRGSREGKYKYLLSNDVGTTNWQKLKPEATPFFFMVPKKLELQSEFNEYWSLLDVFGTGNREKDRGKRWAGGIKTNHDELLTDFDRNDLEYRIQMLSDISLSDEDIRSKFKLEDSKYWNTCRERTKIREGDWHSRITSYLYRPFDKRWILYQPNLIEIGRGGASKFVMRHMMQYNLSLCTMRQVVGASFQHILVSATLNDMNVLASHHVSQVTFPLYLYPSEQEILSGLYKPDECRPNLNPEFIEAFSKKLGLKFVEDGKGDFAQTFGPEDIFNYAYAVFHKIDFPRLPLTSDKALFKALVAKGAELVALHLMESPKLNNLITSYSISGSNMVEKVSYDENNKRIYINKLQYFEGVESEVWDFQVGGYQVCQKWLKDRKGRTLTYDDLTHYQRIVVALKETIRLMSEIDSLIPSWPIQ
jgi:predicted helicase